MSRKDFDSKPGSGKPGRYERIPADLSASQPSFRQLMGATDTEHDLSKPSGYRYRRRQSRRESEGDTADPQGGSDTDEYHDADDTTEPRGTDDLLDDSHPHHNEVEEAGGEAVDEDDEEDEDEDADEDEDEEEEDPYGDYGDSNEDQDEADGTTHRPPARRHMHNIFGALSSSLAPAFASRIRPIVASLQDHTDPTNVMIALEELSELLLVSNEDMLLGYFPSQTIAEELVSVMRDPMFEGSPELMLLACRNISNLIEALPSSINAIVVSEAIPVLCQKLLEIQYIDLAEQVLTTLEKISDEHPRAVLNAGGLNAVLSYLDFFSVHTQRSALKTAANCCFRVSSDSLPVILDIIPTLQNTLSNSDSVVVENACICICEIVNNFSKQPTELELIVTPELLKKLLGLLDPGISGTHGLRTRLFRVISIVAKSSSSLTLVLIQEKAGDLVYQILTQHTPIFDGADALRKDNRSIIQALIHASKDVIVTSLKFILEILPAGQTPEDCRWSGPYRFKLTEQQQALATERADLLGAYPDALNHFCRTTASLLLDVYSASIDQTIRQLVLSGLLRIVCALDGESLKLTLKNLELASLVCSIFAQADFPSLILGAIEVSTVIADKMPEIYLPAFYRIGVMTEVDRLLDHNNLANSVMTDRMDVAEDENDESVVFLNFDSDLSGLTYYCAEQLHEAFSAAMAGSDSYEADTRETMSQLKQLAHGIRSGTDLAQNMTSLSELVSRVSSFELVQSGVLNALLSCLVNSDERKSLRHREQFKSVFLRTNTRVFETLVSGLHEALGRAEHFDVITSGIPDTRVTTPAAALARQVRIKLVGEEGVEDVPSQLKSVVMTIQAIATFKAVEDFFRSKLAVYRLFSGQFRRDIGLGSGPRSRRLSEVLRSLSSVRSRLEGGDIVEHLSSEQGEGDDADVAESESMEQEEAGAEAEAAAEAEVEEELETQEIPEDEADRPDEPSESTRDDESAPSSSPEDWHLEFYMGGEPIPHDGTIVGAIYKYLEAKDGDNAGPRTNHSFDRSIWSDTFTVRYKKVAGVAPPAVKRADLEAEDLNALEEVPVSFGTNPVIVDVVRLLSVLFAVNSSMETLPGAVPYAKVPDTVFLNSKLTAKLNRQLEEPLIIASAIIPAWMVDATRLYPFLFPFDSRYMFLQSTSFGYSRSMVRWQAASRNNEDSDRHSERLPMGRLVRQKVRVSRDHIMHSAVKVMELCGASPNLLEVEFFDEVGTGLGPTLEFYSAVSREFSLKQYRMWRTGDADAKSVFAYSQQGLFPAPMSQEMLDSNNGTKILRLFNTLGAFIARALLDSRIIDINLNPLFFALARGTMTSAYTSGLIACVDKHLASSLSLLERFVAERRASSDSPVVVDGVTIDELSLDFTLPGYPEIELVAGGAHRAVTIDNVDQYVDLVIDMTVGRGVAAQIDSFRAGFSEVFPYSALYAFTPQELAVLCGQGEEDWSYATLMDTIKADHGYTKSSPIIKQFVEIMSEFTQSERRGFLQFMTGSPNLPIGGFQALNPPFTVVWKQNEDPFGRDDYLPSVMTCANYLKLPNYTSKEVLRERLLKAVQEGSGAFLLS